MGSGLLITELMGILRRCVSTPRRNAEIAAFAVGHHVLAKATPVDSLNSTNYAVLYTINSSRPHKHYYRRDTTTK